MPYSFFSDLSFIVSNIIKIDPVRAYVMAIVMAMTLNC